MKNFFKIAKVSFMVMVCALFLGIGIKAEAAPGAITNLRQVKDDVDAVQVQWTAPSGDVAGYVVEHSDNATFTNSSPVEVSANFSGIITGLKAGKSYYIKMAAVDSNGEMGAVSSAIEVVTTPVSSKQITDVKQTDAGANAITLSWTPFDGANMYEVSYRVVNTTTSKTADTSNGTASYTLSGLTEDNAYSISVCPARKNSTGTYIARGYNASASNAVYMFTLPKKVTKVKFHYGGKGTNPDATCAAFSWNPSYVASGYEYTVYGNNGKKMFKGTTPSYKPTITNKNLKNTQFMKIKVRAYVTINGVKKYGPYSDDCWFAKLPTGRKIKEVAGSASNGVKLSWKKVKGAKNYTVYISKSASSGYKKVTTTKKTNCIIKKCGKSSLTTGRYYYRIVANKKVGKKTIKSDTAWETSFGVTVRWR